ncbi:MAG TPA: diguanylate cyclase [Armatimonadota bacterium]|nr:diguanylate cyclase [Armatimonadota bacterium]
MGSLSIRTKLQLIINGLVLVICVSTVLVFYRQVHLAVLHQIRERLSSVASCIAVQNQPDSIRLRPEGESTPSYKRTKAQLRRLMAANPEIKDIYTMRPGKKPMVWEFVVDADDKEPDAVGEEYDVTPYPELRAALSRPSAEPEVIRDKWGYWISGYAPIKDASGRSIGIVGVAMSVDQFNQEMAGVHAIGILAITLAIFASVVLGQAICSFFTGKISALVERLNAAAHGDLSTLADDSRKDEIGDVARAFNHLILSLQRKDKMIRETNTDYLTGLNNHRYFQQRLRVELAKADENSTHVGLLMIDIDLFKLVNDSLGHTVGDEILRQVAGLLMQNVADNQTVSRYGGEEFAVILPDTGAEEAEETAKRLHQIITEASFEVQPERVNQSKAGHHSTIALTVSMGVAAYPLHSKKQDGLIMAADIALHQAKHTGRDRVCAYNTIKEAHIDPYEVYTFIHDPSKSAIEALAAAVDARDHYTRNHSEQVSKYALMIGRGLGLKEGEIELLRKAGLLHDVGKIGIPDYVLNKPSSLTKEEAGIIRTHPAMGESIIRKSRNLDAVLPAILHHHERYDGKGYPARLAGKDIPLLARIIGVADAFDALQANRPYRKSLTAQEAVNELRKNSGMQFDPEIVEAFVSQIELTTESTFLDKAA